MDPLVISDGPDHIKIKNQDLNKTLKKKRMFNTMNIVMFSCDASEFAIREMHKLSINPSL